MRGRKVRPRPDQIAELTRGLRLPLEPIADEHLEILAKGLQQAFDDIRASAPDAVAVGEEPEVTALMAARLKRLVGEDPFWRQLVLYVAREEEHVSFDGSHLKKQPDLSIVLSSANLRFPLVVEAKILDAPASKRVARYCSDGIRRFMEGEYAWGNGEAFMVGYVRDGSSINTTLERFLSQAAHSRRYRVESLPVPVGDGSSDLAYTRHGRSFVYGSQPPPNEPGPISIWHLWLS